MEILCEQSIVLIWEKDDIKGGGYGTEKKRTGKEESGKEESNKEEGDKKFCSGE